MKFRILDSLDSFSRVSSLDSAPPLFLELKDDLDLSMEALRDLSKLRLKEILHNYAFFDVSTIDKFTHRVIRTFAKDLKISQNFEVVLDMDLLLSEAVARVLSKAGEDPELTKILMDFAMEKIDEDKSWDIEYDLFKIGKLLNDENNFTHLENLSSKKASDFVQLQKKILDLINCSKKIITNESNSALLLIKSNKLEFKDFKASYFPKFMLQLSAGNFKVNFEASWKQNFKHEKPYNKSTRECAKLIIDKLHPEFNSQMERIKNELNQLNFLQNIYGNLVPLTILNTIEQELKQIQTEKDQLSISEFNQIISKEIKNQPAPFIYERLGEKYKHYFIDEFQDTSEMQWNNLIPLIANALEGTDDQGRSGSLFLVGDAKQAIYRWRGGHAEQFLDLATKKSHPFTIKGETHQLPKNYRSQDEIIRFNNEFFQNVGGLLDNPTYQEFFKVGNQQETNNKPGGYIKLSFLQEEMDTAYGENVLQAIENSLKAGFQYGDICILVRKKKHGVSLTNFLMNKEVPVISSDSLLLSTSPKVQFLISLVRFILISDDPATNYGILDYLSGSEENKHDFIHFHLNELPQFLSTEYTFDIEKIKGQSLLDCMEHAIKVFDLEKESDAHLMSFMDFVFDMEQQYGTDAQTLLNNWELKSKTLSIGAPEDSKAVQVMTIHKSKGLEFPVVIFPYANTNIYEEIDPKLWIPVDPELFLGFDELLISKKQEVKNYGEIGTRLFEQEQQRLQLDALNLLYVALTRGVNALYIISCQDLKKDGDYKPENYSGLFIKYLMDKSLWNQGVLEYEFGKMNPPKRHQISDGITNTVPYLYSYKERDSFKINTRAGMLWDTDRELALQQGNIYHHILEHVYSKKDLGPALEKALQKGVISGSSFEYVRETLIKLIGHPDLNKFYGEDIIAYNEKELLLSNGSILIPDRVVLMGNSISIIDYKTGQKSPKYKEQLESYANAYQDMGYTVKNKIIAYINENIIVEFI